MVKQEKSQWKGGLLGDEMGMGKTIQAVSLIMSDYPAKDPTLVVVVSFRLSFPAQQPALLLDRSLTSTFGFDKNIAMFFCNGEYSCRHLLAGRSSHRSCIVEEATAPKIPSHPEFTWTVTPFWLNPTKGMGSATFCTLLILLLFIVLSVYHCAGCSPWH